jgi:hypothetical protein
MPRLGIHIFLPCMNLKILHLRTEGLRCILRELISAIFCACCYTKLALLLLLIKFNVHIEPLAMTDTCA